MKDVEIGMITAPVGIRGEVRVKSYAGDPSRFRKIHTVGLKLRGNKGAVTDFAIEHVRNSGGMVVLKLEGVDDRNAAELLRSTEVFMDRDDLEKLPAGQHYIRDLIGLDVVLDDTGEKIGKVEDILTDRPQDIYVISRDGADSFMVPGVPEFIKDIDEDGGVIRVSLIEGMC